MWRASVARRALATPYEVYTDQTIRGIANGTYTLKAWVASGGGQNAAFMSAKNYDSGPELKANIPETGWPNWTQVSIDNIEVTNGQVQIGFYSNANAGNWLSFDDVELYQK
jgi:arabinogalactan endo-1,4-beta-galactosidase